MNVVKSRKEEIIKKSNDLEDLREYLKSEFIGIDKIIDGVIESMKPYYIFPESLVKPVVVSLWGMTGTGKTSLIEKIVDFLGLRKSYIKYDMGNNVSEYGFMSIFKKTTSNNNIIVLDEFQIGRTIDEEKKEKDNACRYIWDLVDNGKITSYKNYDYENSSTILKYVRRMIKIGIDVDDEGYIVNLDNYVDNNTAFGRIEKCDTCDLKLKDDRGMNVVSVDINKDKIKQYDIKGINLIKWVDFHSLVDSNPDFFDFDSSIENRDKFFKKPLNEILEILEECVRTSEQIKIYDYSKSIIFCLGNLDEVYTMSHDTNPDICADMFHDNSLKINMMDVKKALQKRFRVEQIARLGNNHFIYPAFNSESYKKFISKYLYNTTKRVEKDFGLHINFDNSVNDIIYDEGVFPAQGIRPLLSTLNNFIDNNLSNVITQLIITNDDCNNIRWFYDDKKFVIIDSNIKLEYKVDTILTDLRKIDNNQKQAMVSVHEAGHGLISSLLMGLCPDEILSKTASADAGGYCLYNPRDEYKTKDYFLKDIRVYLAGMEAEKLIFGEDNVSTGAYRDISQATKIASEMVKSYGMVDTPILVSAITDKDIFHTTFLKTDTRENIIENIIIEAQKDVEKLLLKHRADLLKLSKVLYNKPKIYKDEIKEILSHLNIEWKDKCYFDFETVLLNQIEENLEVVLI